MKYTYHKNFGEIYDFEIVYSHLFSNHGHYKIIFDCYCIDNKDYDFQISIITTNVRAIDDIKDLIYDGEDYNKINEYYHKNFFDQWLFESHAAEKIETNV